MNTELSQKQIGQRIAELRKIKGLSQGDLAKSVRISRPSLAQIELGNRSVNILELQKLSQVLGFSLDDFKNNFCASINSKTFFSSSNKTECKEKSNLIG